VLLAAHMNVAVPSFAEVAPDLEVSEELEQTVMRCLSKDPAERFPSMEALARALSFCGETTGTLPSSLPSSGEIPAYDPTKSAPGDRTENTALERGAPPAKKRAVLIAALLAGGLLAAGAVAWMRSNQTPPETPEVASSPEVSEPEPEPEPEPEETVDEAEETEGADPAITRVHVDTVPAGAHLSRDGRDLGDAPAALVVPRGESWEIAIAADGYETRNVMITGGQEGITVSLDRETRRARRRRSPTTGTPMETAMEATMDPEATMETTPTMTTMGRQSENRDPWAR